MPTVDSSYSISFSIAFGLAVGVAFGLANFFSGAIVGRATHAWTFYALACFKLATQRRLPAYLMRFLREAEHLGLLRVTGPTYQFRHIVVQNYFSRRVS
jgi:hypothetical protein